MTYELKSANELRAMLTQGQADKESIKEYATAKLELLQRKEKYHRARLWERLLNDIEAMPQIEIVKPDIKAAPKKVKAKKKGTITKATYKTLIKYAKKRNEHGNISLEQNIITYANGDYIITLETDTQAKGIYNALHVDAGLYDEPVILEDSAEYNIYTPKFDKEKEIASLAISLDDLIYLSNAMTTEKTCYHLRGICADIKNNTLVSTSGHILNMLNHDYVMINGLDDIERFKPIIPDYVIHLAIDGAKEHKADSVSIRLYDEGLTIIAGGYTIEARYIDSTFPQYLKVIPKHADNKKPVSFDFSNIAQEKKQAKAMGQQYPCEPSPFFECEGGTRNMFNKLLLQKILHKGEASQADNMSPMRIDSGNKTSCIMPLRR